MNTIGLGEVQKNIGIISKTKKPIKVIDKRKNIDVAIIFPTNQDTKKSIIDLGGKLKPNENILKKSKELSFNEIKNKGIKNYINKHK